MSSSSFCFDDGEFLFELICREIFASFYRSVSHVYILRDDSGVLSLCRRCHNERRSSFGGVADGYLDFRLWLGLWDLDHNALFWGGARTWFDTLATRRHCNGVLSVSNS